MKNNENEVFSPPPPPPEYVEQPPQGYVQHPSPAYVQHPAQGHIQHVTPGYVQHPSPGFGQQPGPAIVPIAVPTKVENSNFIVCLNLISVITHILLGAVAMGAFVYINIAAQLSSTNLSYLSSHVYLTIFGYGLLLTQTVLSLKPYTGWANNLLYPQKNSVYWMVQILGSSLALIGCIMGIISVNNFWPARHLRSSHAIFGLITLILTSVSLVGGIANAVNQNIGNNALRKALHTHVNVLILLMAFTAVGLVFKTRQSFIINLSFLLLPVNANVLLCFTVFTMGGLLSMVLANIFKRGTMLI